MARSALAPFHAFVGPFGLAGLLAFAPGCDAVDDDDDEGYVDDDDEGYVDDDVEGYVDDDDDDDSGSSGDSDDADNLGDTSEAVPLVEALSIAQDEFPDATIIDAALSTAPGSATWDFELFADGIEYEVYVSADDGSVLETGEDMLAADDAAEARAEATLVRSSPGWDVLIDAAESAAEGLAFELDTDADDGMLEVYVRAEGRWTVEFDASGEILDMDPS